MRQRSADVMARELISRGPEILAPAQQRTYEENLQVFTEAVSNAEDLAKSYSPLRDRWMYYIVVGILGTVLLVVVIGSMIFGHDPDQAMIALASAALGALAGLLAPSPNEPE